MDRTSSPDTNLIVIIGSVAKDAAVAETDDGRVFTSFDVVCRLDGARTVVPVTVEQEIVVQSGARVAVLGRVEKRFFPSGGGFAARTDVRAESVTVLRRTSQTRRVLATAVARLGQ